MAEEASARVAPPAETAARVAPPAETAETETPEPAMLPEEEPKTEEVKTREDRSELEHDFLDHAKAFEWDKVKTMLQDKPDLINVQPCGRWSALHQAAYEGKAEVVRELIDLGADAAATTRQGKTVYAVAKGEAKTALAPASSARGAAPAEAAAKAGEAAAKAGEAAAKAPAAPPPMKKARKELTLRMNINDAVDHEYHECSLKELCDAPISAINGIGEKTKEVLKKYHIKTIRQLGRWRFFKMSKAMLGLSALEVKDGRSEDSPMNVKKAMDKKHWVAPLTDIMKMPPSALSGLSEKADEDFVKLKIYTIQSLGQWKFALRAEWITDLAEFESGD